MIVGIFSVSADELAFVLNVITVALDATVKVVRSTDIDNFFTVTVPASWVGQL